MSSSDSLWPINTIWRQSNQAIVGIDVDFLSVRSCGILLRTISQEMATTSTLDISFKTTYEKISNNLKITITSSGGQWVNSLRPRDTYMRQ